MAEPGEDEDAPLLAPSQGSRGSRSSLLALERTSTPLGTTPTTYCLVCCERHPTEETVTLSACGHRFGRECLEGWLHYEINSNGKVYLKCFYTDSIKHLDWLDNGVRANGAHYDSRPGAGAKCGVLLSERDVMALIEEDPATLRKYRTFKLNLDHPETRQCPVCDHSQRGDPLKPHPLECESCKHVYCFLHGDQHPNKTCQEFRNTETKSEALINALSKKCPGCKSAIIRHSGCNHMKCSKCGCSFCWICLALVDDVPAPDHYAAWNIHGCPGRQMENATPARRALGYGLTGWQLTGWRKGVFLVIMGVFYLWFFGVIAPISACLTLLVLLFGFSCLCKRINPWNDTRQWLHAVQLIFQTWAYVACVLFSCVCCLPLTVVFCMVKACGLNPRRAGAVPRDLDRPWQSRDDAIRDMQLRREQAEAEEKAAMDGGSVVVDVDRPLLGASSS